ncbi:hypothetical protein V1525DRAFT_401130 [Lipomyces kononenkoae]|uniref:Uncharacterized protein n=1 Tax=Lipomyces kononenkoae TaxID=34357 RepID=A0ACC3T3G1_LIPKO
MGQRLKLVLPPPRLLTLDAFGTIYRPYPPVPDQYSQIYSQHFPTHPPVPPSLISTSFRKAYKARVQSHPNYLGGEKDWWTNVIKVTFTIAAADAFTASSHRAPNAGLDIATEAFVNDLYQHFNSGKAYMLMPDITGFLDSIHRRVMRIGVLSNSDTRCRVVLRELGVLSKDHSSATAHGDKLGRSGNAWIKRDQDVVLSCEVGAEKPDPRMFEAAVDKLIGGADTNTFHREVPEGDVLAVAKQIQYWHVGDDIEKDVLPLVDTSNACKLQGWGAVYLKRSVGNTGGEVRLTHGGRVIEVSDLRDIMGLWSHGVEVIVE